MSAIDDIVELADKHGVVAVAAAVVVYLVITLAPKAFEYWKNRKERMEARDDRKEQQDSVFVVYGVDENKDVWLYSVFKTEEEAEKYKEMVKNVVDEQIVLLTNELKFTQMIKGFEAYNPYSQKYFGVERATVRHETRKHQILPENTTPSTYTINSTSANSYQKIRDWMENHYD